MNRILFFFGTLFSAIVFDAGIQAQPASPWTELLNGKDFTGWKASENSASWTVVDGMFQTVGKRSHLWYVGEELKDGFRNFEIEVQVKTFKLANSGIYFHTEYQETGFPLKGFEIQVNNSHVGEGDYLEFKRNASLYGIRNVYKVLDNDDQWMTIRARVEGNHVQVWCNGLKTVDYVQPLHTGSGVKQLSRGTFCLQGHDPLSKAQYRSFKVRRLSGAIKPQHGAPDFGPWYDSLMVLQHHNFAFIDLNPPTSLTATALANYCYATGINTSLVKTPATAKDFSTAKNLPLFLGLKITSKDLAKAPFSAADYIIGESTDLASARTLLKSGHINTWSDKGHTLNEQTAPELLALANQYSVAVEIDNTHRTPSIEVLTLAKAKGLQFSFTGLLPLSAIEQSQYLFEVIKLAGLEYRDLYIPGR
jgi:Domain of Unknown Function (DUF1080)